jgi:cyclophilin family peptidyl-prolyl cis-trans isomerase
MASINSQPIDRSNGMKVHPWRLLAIGLVSGLLVIVGGSASPLHAQDAANDPPPAAPTDDTPAADAPARTPAARAPQAAGEATARFNELVDEWKGVLKELRRLKTEYDTADAEQAKQLQEQWQRLVAQGNELLVDMREAGREAYGEGEAVDPQLERFLLNLTEDAVNSDDYETGLRLASAMLARAERDQAPAPKILYNLAGIAAFATNDYEAARKHFDQARDAAALDARGQQYDSLVEKYQGYWEQELALREKEAEANDLPRVKISTTAGDMVVELFENEAPETVGNFVSLVEADFYNGLNFHRVLPHFMAQGGDPKGNGSGGPGYNIYCETDHPNARRHFRGTLSMAKTEFRDTGGSQFFICFTQQEPLDGKHTAFGRVIEGFDVLSRIQRIDPQNPSPVEPTKINSMEVLRKRDHRYLPRKVE